MQTSVLAIVLISYAALQLPVSAAILPSPSAHANLWVAQANSTAPQALNERQQAWLQQAIETTETIADPMSQARTFAEIAALYLQYGQSEQASNFLKKASAIANTISDPQIKAQSLINIASVESQLPLPPTARIEALQAMIAQVPTTSDRDSLFLGLAELQANQGQLAPLVQSLAQVKDPDVTEYIEYGALINYGFWAFEPNHLQRAIAEIERAEHFPPLRQPPIAFRQPPASPSTADDLTVQRIKILTYLFERAAGFHSDDTSPAQTTAQQQVLLTEISQQITHLQEPTAKLEQQAQWMMALASSGEFQADAVAQYNLILAVIAAHPSSALSQAALLATLTVKLADPASPSAQRGVQLAETLLAQIEDSQVTGKVVVLHQLAALLVEVQPERAARLTQQASRLIARIPQAADRTAAWMESALLYQRMGCTATAIAALEQIMPLLDAVADPLQLALRWYELGEPERAKQIAEQTQNNATFSSLATLYIGQGDLEAALDLKAQATQPLTQIDILQQVSQAEAQAGQTERAVTLAQEAIALLHRIPPTDEMPQASLTLLRLSVLGTYSKTGIPLEAVFRQVDAIEQPEVQAAFYGRWLQQDDRLTNQAAIWPRFERAIVAIRDPRLRDRGWSDFALSAISAQQTKRFEQAIAAIQDPQVKADTLLVAIGVSRNLATGG